LLFIDERIEESARGLYGAHSVYGNIEQVTIFCGPLQLRNTSIVNTHGTLELLSRGGDFLVLPDSVHGQKSDCAYDSSEQEPFGCNHRVQLRKHRTIVQERLRSRNMPVQDIA